MELTERIEGLTVLVIDMQYGFLGYSEDRKIIPYQIDVLQFCRRTNTPTIVIEYSGKLLGKTICPLSTITEKIPAYRHLQKNQDSAFSVDELEVLLKEFGTKKLLLMGVRADCCIQKTAIHAIQKGYEVLINDNLISGYKFNEQEVKAWYKENTIYS